MDSFEVQLGHVSKIAILGTGEFGRALADKINMTCSRLASNTIKFIKIHFLVLIGF